MFNGKLADAVRAVVLFGQFSILTRIGRSAKQAHVLLFGNDKAPFDMEKDSRKFSAIHGQARKSSRGITASGWVHSRAPST